MSTATIVGALIAIAIGAFVGHWIGTKKGRPTLGLILGALFTMIGWIIMLVIPKKHPA